MFRPRIIPVLLVKDEALVKSKKFTNYKYIGDPINTVHIFNTLKVDELILLDISASKKKKVISKELVKTLGEETNMPFSVGGGINSVDQIKELLSLGAEKVVISSFAVKNPNFIKIASDYFGSSTIVVCIDVRKDILRREKVSFQGGRKLSKFNPVDFARLMEDMGAGEIIIQSIELDGSMSGYDIGLINKVSTAVSIPVVALGGGGNINDMRNAYCKGFSSAIAAGSMFVFHGSNDGVLINYPSKEEIDYINMDCDNSGI
jgi:cyclase